METYNLGKKLCNIIDFEGAWLCCDFFYWHTFNFDLGDTNIDSKSVMHYNDII